MGRSKEEEGKITLFNPVVRVGNDYFSQRCDVYQFLTMRCLGDVLTKTLPCDVLDDVLKKPKHGAYNAY